MKPVTETIIAFAVIAGLLGAGYVTGTRVANLQWQGKWSARDAADNEARTLASENARKDEQQAAENAAAIDKAYQQGAAHAKANADRIIADLHTGALKLRQSLTCTISGADLSNTNSATRISDAARTCGLSNADAEFLIRFAERADQVALQLRAAQAFIQAEYERGKKRANVDAKSKDDVK
jgi:hypothetical protein